MTVHTAPSATISAGSASIPLGGSTTLSWNVAGAQAAHAVAIVDHAGCGTAATGADGRFSLPVEGGGTLTVKFVKTGFIAAQRQVYVPWNDTALVETVNLITGVYNPFFSSLKFCRPRPRIG